MKNTKGTKFLFVLLILGLGCTKKMAQTSLDLKGPFRNIQIDEESFSTGPCEPTISLHPTDPNIIAAGSILDRFYISKDGGLTWSNSKIKSPYGVYGDPVIRYNTAGDILYAHLSNPTGQAYASEEFLDRIVVQKSDDGGETWSEGSFPPANQKKDHDKHWLANDPVNGTVIMSWTEFDEYGSKDEEDKSRILFSRSEDEGVTWSKAIAINELEGDCIDDDFTTEGAVPAVGIDGTYYVAWAFDQKIYLDISEDGGKTWLDHDIMIVDQKGGWTFDVPGIGRCNGMPVLEVDNSKSKYSGNLYLNYADQSNGEDDTDIWVSRSEDSGKTWKDPVRVNNDAPGKHQFFSWMDVDPVTGYVYLVFYDRRNYDDEATDVYLAYSIDGGKTFKNTMISDAPFTPNTGVFFGDYNDIAASNGVIRPIWTELDGLSLSVHTAIINIK